MRRINHPALPNKNPHMRHIINTITPFAPKNQIPLLSLRKRDMLPLIRVILGLSSAGNFAQTGLTDAVLGEPGAVEAAGGFALAAAPAPDVGEAFLRDGG